MYHIDSKKDKPDTNYLLQEVCKMMNRGVNVADMSKIYSLCLSDQTEYQMDIAAKYGIKNPNSTNQIADFMENLNDRNVVEACFSPTGKWSSNKQSLEILSSMGYEFADDIIRYRTAKKYADSVKGIMDAADDTGKIHPSVSMTKTNRISYKSPALMNIPKALLWDLVVPSAPGNMLISADIKNQEPSILINMGNVESLKSSLVSDRGLYEDIFSKIKIHGKMNIIITNDYEPGVIDNERLLRDGVPPVYCTPQPVSMRCLSVGGSPIDRIDIINLVTPVGVVPELPKTIKVATEDSVEELPIQFDIDLNKPANKKKIQAGGIIEVDGEVSGFDVDCTGVYRKEFKRAWNAMTYGASIVGIRQMCKNIDGDLVYKFFTKIPELKKYRDSCTKLANAGQQDVQTYFGTVVSANEFNKSVLKRVLMDLPIQGTAADILSLLVKHFNDEVESRGYRGELWISYTRHDELIIEASKNLVEKLGVEKLLSEISDITSHQVDDWIPFKVEVGVVERSSIRDLINTDEE